MVKKISFSLLTTLFITIIYGQDHRETYAKKNLVGPKKFFSKVEFLIGPSKIYSHGSEWFKETQVLKIGYSAHIGLIHEFSPRLEMSLKTSYENRGNKTITFSLNTDYTPPAPQKHIQDLTLNYVTATLVPRYWIIKNQKLFMGCGPYFGYLVSERYSKELYLNGSLISKSSGRPDPYWDNKKFDFGATMMMGYNIHIHQKRSASIQLLYNLGMKDINKPMISRTRNNSISLVVGITINKNSNKF